MSRLLTTNFPYSHFLSAAGSATLLRDFEAKGIAGGSVSDALVGAAAAERGMLLATRDQRALDTYRALDVRVELIR